MQMSEFQVIPNPIFHDTNKTVEELFSNNSLQFAYYEVNPDRMMGFTAETEDVTIIIYVISGSVYITTPDGKIKVSSHTSIVLDNIQHTYMLVANEVSQLLVFTNTEKVQHIDAANVFRKIINEIEQKDIYTIGHSHRVRKYSSAIALALDPAYDIIPLATAAGLHDVGKIKVPKEILQKPGKLTQEEYQIIKKHPIDTYELLKEYFEEDIAKMASLHHERLDGSGYPYGLKGEEISLDVRIIAVADAFYAMTSHRNYHKDMTYLEAVNELENLPEQYDKKITAILKQLVNDGSLFNI